MAAYFSRSLEAVLRPDDVAPVKIVHGPRAVGKTAMAQRLVDERHYLGYVSLADPATATLAGADPLGWLENLPTRVVIDEAQLLAELPLQIKALVDQVGSARRFLLTGSAAIGRTGLGGSDPLTGRAQIWTLGPMTALELQRRPEAVARVVDLLFGDLPETQATTPAPSRSVLDRAATGGFPNLAIGQIPIQVRNRWVADAVTGVLTDHVLPGERFDASAARRVLDACLRDTGGILNVDSLANRIRLDPKTVNRYLDILERRFLLTFLPNLATNPTRQTRARSKIHPVDAAFAVEALDRGDPTALATADVRGHVFESYVVALLRTAAELATGDVRLFYWRTSKGTHEVDVVLVNGAGKSVGIEVKTSSTLKAQDARGLKALMEARQGVHAGFIVYTGNSIVRLGDRIWAIPFDQLGKEWNQMETDLKLPTGPDIANREGPVDGQIFISYVRADDEHDGGAITRLVDDIQKGYSYQYARRLDVFPDTASLTWGSKWQDQLDNALRDSVFLIPIITPRYLTSQACRDELLKFAAAAKAQGDGRLLLPLIWQSVEGKEIVPKNDPVLSAVLDSQYITAEEMPLLEPGTRDYRAKVTQIVDALHATITSREQTPSHITDLAVDNGGPGLFGMAQRIPEWSDRLGKDSQDFAQALEQIWHLLEEGMPSAAGSGASGLALTAARDLDPAAARLTHSAEQLGEHWKEIADFLAEVRSVSGVFSDEGGLERIDVMLGDLATQLLVVDQDEIFAQVAAIGRVSRFFRPASRAITAALRTVISIRTSILQSFPGA